MDHISKEKHEELIHILEELLRIIEKMKETETNYLLTLNEEEAREWLMFLKSHMGKGELKSLEDEISNRFFYKFDAQIALSEDDNRRAGLMRRYIIKSNEFLK